MIRTLLSGDIDVFHTLMFTNFSHILHFESIFYTSVIYDSSNWGHWLFHTLIITTSLRIDDKLRTFLMILSQVFQTLMFFHKILKSLTTIFCVFLVFLLFIVFSFFSLLSFFHTFFPTFFNIFGPSIKVFAFFSNFSNRCAFFLTFSSFSSTLLHFFSTHQHVFGFFLKNFSTFETFFSFTFKFF